MTPVPSPEEVIREDARCLEERLRKLLPVQGAIGDLRNGVQLDDPYKKPVLLSLGDRILLRNVIDLVYHLLVNRRMAGILDIQITEEPHRFIDL